ncbi:MAG TPA: hypothetical protein VG028_17425 [Terriglobia bacterium]|nr:hypothetical protein [Terriglobia bacterium]
MKLNLCVAILVAACMAQAKGPRFYEKGTLVEMKSVDCGVDAKGAEGVGAILGVDDTQHTKSRQMLCQEYLLRADHMDYKIRPKEEKHPALLPIGQEAEFRIQKDRMHMLVPELDNHEREYIVVSVTQRTEAGTSKPAHSTAVAQK